MKRLPELYMANNLLPQRIVGLPPSNILQGRASIDAVFVKKHNLEVNLEIVKEETENIPKSRLNNWLFLAEGHKKYRAVENIYLDEYVERHGVKIEDPIIAPFTSKIAESASLDKTIAALSILTMDYLDHIHNSDFEKLNETQIELLFNQVVDALAKAFEISPTTLKQEFLKLEWNNREALAKQLLLLSQKRGQLIRESNTQSTRHLGEILKRNNHPNLFIMSGIEHAIIFTQ